MGLISVFPVSHNILIKQKLDFVSRLKMIMWPTKYVFCSNKIFFAEAFYLIKKCVLQALGISLNILAMEFNKKLLKINLKMLYYKQCIIYQL